MSFDPRFCAAFVMALPFLALSACSDTGPRVYTAQPYDSGSQCLGEYEALGLVQADELPASCAPTCLGVSGTVYVSTVCAPYPDTASVLSAEESEDCAAALTAQPCE